MRNSYLLCMTVLQLAGMVLGPLVHRHVLPAPATVYSAGDGDRGLPGHPPLCEACVAHASAALPAATWEPGAPPAFRTLPSNAAPPAAGTTLAISTRARAPPPV